MKTYATSRGLTLGRWLSDAELAAFAGGVTEGGCVPDPLKDFWEKYGGSKTVTVEQK